MDDFNIDNEEKQNVIIEINKDVEDTLYDEDRVVSEENDTLVVTNNKKNNKKKNKKKFSWNNLTKKGKIIFISIVSVIVFIPFSDSALITP